MALLFIEMCVCDKLPAIIASHTPDSFFIVTWHATSIAPAVATMTLNDFRMLLFLCLTCIDIVFVTHWVTLNSHDKIAGNVKERDWKGVKKKTIHCQCTHLMLSEHLWRQFFRSLLSNENKFTFEVCSNKLNDMKNKFSAANAWSFFSTLFSKISTSIESPYSLKWSTSSSQRQNSNWAEVHSRLLLKATKMLVSNQISSFPIWFPPPNIAQVNLNYSRVILHILICLFCSVVAFLYKMERMIISCWNWKTFTKKAFGKSDMCVVICQDLLVTSEWVSMPLER